jgi:hypothetical protein
MIRIRPEQHRGGSTSTTIEVERSDDGGFSVWLSIRDEDDRRFQVALLPDEAHALAANLAHFAARADRAGRA